MRRRARGGLAASPPGAPGCFLFRLLHYWSVCACAREREMAPKKTVVITGASGTIASLVLEALRERYDVRALDLRASDGIAACDLLGPREQIRPFFAGADAVVHMAFVPPPSGVSSATTGPGHTSDGGSSDDGANDKLFAAEHLNVQMA